jgi:hypothetical protein
MIICDKCPIAIDNFELLESYCGISGVSLTLINLKHTPISGKCPMKSIELKDGTVFVPEEVNAQ